MRRVLSIFAATLLTANLSGQATQTNEDQALSNESSPMEVTRYIGEYYGGGIIFYVQEDGKHGLITRTVEKSKWKHGAFTNDYTVRDGVATSNFNKKRIQAIRNSEAYKAQENASDQRSTLGKWYLPTRYDMNKLYMNRSVIGGYTAFSKGWKSLETSSLNAWFQSFVVGVSFSNGKDDEEYIRIVREF